MDEPGDVAAARRRLGLIYFLSMASLGGLHPFLAPALTDAGASEAAVPLIIAAFPVARLTAGPALGWVADRFARPGLVLQGSAFGAAACALALGVAPTWVLMGVAVYAFAMCRVPLFPLLDVRIMRTPGGYGTVRVWGSVGFILAVIAVGFFADANPRLPALVASGALAATGLVTLGLPRGGPSTRDPLLPAIRRLLAIPELRPLWVVSALHAATLATYDHLYSLHVAAEGFSARVTAAGVAAGIVVEITVLAAGPRLLERFGGGPLIVASVAASIPRWIVTGTTGDPWVLAGIQTLHGVGFGCWWIGGIGLLARLAPEDLRNSAQALFVFAAYGVGALMAMGGSAVVLGAVGTAGLFLGLTAVSAAGLIAAAPLWRR